METTRRRFASVSLSLAALSPLADLLSQLDLLVGREQAHLSDLLEVHPDGIVQIIFRRKLQRVDQLFLLVHRRKLVVFDHPAVVDVRIQLQLCADDLNTQRVEGIVDLLDLLDRQVEFFQLGGQLGRLDCAVALGLGDQCADVGHGLLIEMEAFAFVFFVFFEFAINAHPHSCDLTRAISSKTAHPNHYIPGCLRLATCFLYFSLFYRLFSAQISIMTGRIMGLRLVVLKR